MPARPEAGAFDGGVAGPHRPVAAVGADTQWAPQAQQGWAKRGIEVTDCYWLPTVRLDRYTAVFVCAQADQEFLARSQASLRRYLDEGGAVVFSGHLHRDWLPGAGRFIPKHIDDVSDYELAIPEPAHPVARGIDPEQLAYRRGVAGFFARGHHPPPPGAVPVVVFRSGEPVLYVDEVSTGGCVVAHAGNDLLNYLGDGSARAQLVDQLLAWLRSGRA